MRSSRTETPARAVAAQTIAAPAIATAPMPAPQTPATVAIAPRAVVTATTGAPVALTETLRTTSAAPSRQTLRVKPSRAVLRAGPGTQFRVLGGAERDQVLEWTTERGGWLQVRTPFEAWIRADLAERSAQ
jgi:hypothetical protein